MQIGGFDDETIRRVFIPLLGLTRSLGSELEDRKLLKLNNTAKKIQSLIDSIPEDGLMRSESHLRIIQSSIFSGIVITKKLSTYKIDHLKRNIEEVELIMQIIQIYLANEDGLKSKSRKNKILNNILVDLNNLHKLILQKQYFDSKLAILGNRNKREIAKIYKIKADSEDFYKMLQERLPILYSKLEISNIYNLRDGLESLFVFLAGTLEMNYRSGVLQFISLDLNKLEDMIINYLTNPEGINLEELRRSFLQWCNEHDIADKKRQKSEDQLELKEEYRKEVVRALNLLINNLGSPDFDEILIDTCESLFKAFDVPDNLINNQDTLQEEMLIKIIDEEILKLNSNKKFQNLFDTLTTVVNDLRNDVLLKGRKFKSNVKSHVYEITTEEGSLYFVLMQMLPDIISHFGKEYDYLPLRYLLSSIFAGISEKADIIFSHIPCNISFTAMRKINRVIAQTTICLVEPQNVSNANVESLITTITTSLTNMEG